MKNILAVLLLLFASQAFAQQNNLVVGIKPSQQQIDEAKKKAAEGQVAQQFLNVTQAPVVRQINVGEYITFTLGSTGQLWLWDGGLVDPKKDYCVQRYDVAAGAGFAISQVKGDTAELIPFKPQDKPWGILYGRKTGHVVIIVVVNGDNGGEPVIVTILDITVGPYVPPEPPGPKPPTPGTSPFPDPGFRVMAIFETADLSKITPQQRAVITSATVREYLDVHCVKGPKNTPEWRFVDKDTDTTNETAVWQNAMKFPRQSLPWLLVGDGKKGFSGPLPTNVDDMMKVLKSIGGD